MVDAGQVDVVNGVERYRLARLMPTEEVGPTFTPDADAEAKGTALQASSPTDWRIVVVRQLSRGNNVEVHSIARLRADGSVDQDFNTGSGMDTPKDEILALVPMTGSTRS